MSKAIKVLVVEDSDDDAGVAIRILRRGGFDAQYERVESAAAMAAALQRQTWDAVVSDFNLPGFTGLDALGILQAAGLDIPFILISGAIGEETAAQAMKAGASDYVLKGNLARLAPALERELKEAQTRAAHRRAQRELAESEARFRSLTEMSSDFYWESDAEHRLTRRGSAKPSAVSVFQRGAQIGERRWDIPYLSPDEAGWQAHRAMLDAHLPFRDFEISRLGADGTERHISLSGDPVFDAAGAFKGYRGIGTDITERKHADRLLRQITEGTASTTGEEFMRTLTRTLAEALGVRYAFVGELVDPGRDRAKVISMWNGLEHAEPFEYSLAGTPCKVAVEEAECFYPSGVQDLFPHDQDLVTLGIDSYLGIRLQSSKGEPLGLLTVMHTRKLPHEALARSVLRIFAARAGAELERLHSSEALERSEQRFAKAFRSSPLAVLLTRLADGKVLEANEAAGELLGRTREEMLGRSTLELGIWADASDRERAAEELRRTGTVRGLEHLIRRKSGETRIVQDWLERIELEGESCIVGSLLDVTEARRAAEALLDSETRFRAAFDQAAVGMARREIEGRFLDVNKKLCDILGYTREELLGLGSTEISPAEERQRAVEFNQCLRRGELSTYSREKQYLRKNGTPVWVNLSINVVNGSDGKPDHVIAVMEDINQRKLAEEALRASEAQLSLVTENIPAAVAYVSRDLAIRFANRRYEELFFRPGSDAIGRHVRETIGDKAWAEIEPQIARVMAGETLEYQRSHVRPDGAQRTLEVHLEPKRASGGEVLGYYAFVLDITRRKQAERALRESEARFRNLTELSSDFYWEQDEQFRFVERIGPVHEQQGRYPLNQAIGKARWEIPSLNMTAADWAKHREDLEAHREFRDLVIERPDEAGFPRFISTSGQPIFDSEGRFKGYRGVGKDITERKRAERMLRLEHAVTRALAGADSVLGTVESVLRAVCETEGWECGRYFQLDEKAAVLRFGIAWGMPEENAQRFIAGWRDATYTPGVGLPGHVWQTAQPLWVADGDKDPRASRPKLGRDTGMHSAFLFPILSEGKTIGVMAFNSRKVREPDERLLEATGVIGSQIGQFLQRTRAEQALRLRNRALEASVNAIMISDSSQEDNPIVYVNPAFERNTGYTAAEVQGRNPRFLLGTDTDQPGLEELRTARAEQREGSALLRNYRKDGTQFWNELRIAPVRDPQGRVTHFVGVQNDVTERVRYQAEIERQANFDSLTGLANRNLLSDRLRQAIVRVERAGRVGAVLFLDLDRFKVINDSLGHAMGDRVLAQIGWRLSEAVRGDDTVARAGGDEFVVVLTDLAREEDVAVIAQKLLGVVASPLSIEGRDFLLGTSIGVALFPRDGADPDTLLKHADVALYRAKESGGGGVAFFAREMNERAVNYFNLERDLRHALERGEFVLHYQPIIAMASGEIVGAEALIRWRRESGQMVSPMDFIPIAEESGLIVPIGAWVLREAAARAREWNADGRRQLSVAVNLSARQFRDPKLVEMVCDALAETGLERRLLILEITESTVMHNAEEAIAALLALREIGVSLSVDDFGTGYSSLSYLKRLPLNHLKVDRSFVKDIPGDSDDIAITRAVIELAHSLELKVVAEGVETDEQRKFLVGQGCDYAQGYLFSKPIEAEAFRALVKGRGSSAAIGNPRRRPRVRKR